MKTKTQKRVAQSDIISKKKSIFIPTNSDFGVRAPKSGSVFVLCQPGQLSYLSYNAFSATEST